MDAYDYAARVYLQGYGGGGDETSEGEKDPLALAKVRFESFGEGEAAQALRIGPFSEERPTVRKVHDFIERSGKELRGKHHEIHLSDIRKAAPEKWRTVIRQAMQ